MGQERLGPSYFFIALVLGPLNSLVWYVPSFRYTRGLGWRIHCGVLPINNTYQEHLSWRVQWGRDLCLGCGQTRGEDTPILTCSGCGVAKFCSADHQKMASKKVALGGSGGSLLMGRHKDICGVLRKWRKVVKDGEAPDSCSADLV